MSQGTDDFGICWPKEPAELEGAQQFILDLKLRLRKLTFAGDSRDNAGTACLAAALEYHEGIVTLIRAHLYGAAFAMVRVLFEAYVRGVWLSLCASEKESTKFVGGKLKPCIGTMIQALEQHPAYQSTMLSTMKRKSWDAMCAYSDTGAHQVQRWMAPYQIGTRHSPEEASEVLHFSRYFGTLAACAIAANAEDTEENDALFIDLLEELKTLTSRPMK